VTQGQPEKLPDRLEAVVAGAERPSWDDYFMATALLLSSRSSCERLHVGCLMVSSGPHPNRIVAAGYNGFLPGAPHDSKIRDGHEQATVHAEQNALRYVKPDECALIAVTLLPCNDCLRSIASYGIKTVVYRDIYDRDITSISLAIDFGIELIRISDNK